MISDTPSDAIAPIDKYPVRTRTYLGLFIGAYELHALWILASTVRDGNTFPDRTILVDRRGKDGEEPMYSASIVQSSIYSIPTGH